MSRTALAAEGRRNAEVMQAMGMRRQAALRWQDVNSKYLAAHERASDVASGLGGASKVFRSILQSAVLAVGAFLVINQEVNGWHHHRRFDPDGSSARAGRDRHRQLEGVRRGSAVGPAARPFAQAAAQGGRASGAAGADRGAGRSNSFMWPRRIRGGRSSPTCRWSSHGGQAVGIIGPSGSGKSTLARALVGVWPRLARPDQLDNAALDQWSSEALGKHIGYLPQDVELFDGSIARNIARFDPQANPADVLEAAKAAGVHDLILSFPEGYGTKVGEGGVALSAGQRQTNRTRPRALRQAVPGRARRALVKSRLRRRGSAHRSHRRACASAAASSVVVAHRPKALEGVDHVLVIGEGRMQSFGPKDEVLSRVLRKPVALNVVADNPGGGKMNSSATPALHSIQRYMIVGGAIMVGCVTFGIGGWAATSQLSGAVIGQGVVVVDSSVKKVQHATGGIVGELRVRDGDRVKAGDILIRLDETQTLANATIVTKSVDELLARRRDWRAERDNADQIVFPKALLDRSKDAIPTAGGRSRPSASCSTCGGRRGVGRRRSSRSAARSCRTRSRAMPARRRPSERKSI